MPTEVPAGWAEKPLRQIASESKARFDPAQESRVLPYVGLEHIVPGASTVEGYGSSSDVTSQKTLFRPHDILFGKLRPYLRKVAAVDREGVCSTDILAIRPKNGTDAGFLLTVLSRDRTIKWATDRSAGTKMPRTSWKALGELDVLIPPLLEQKKIAAILSSVDEAIQATQAVIEQTRRVKEGLLQDLLTRGIGPGGVPHTRFKQTEIGEIPESWEVCSLQHMGHDEKSVLKTGPFGSSLKGEHFAAAGVPVLNIQSLGVGELVGGHFFVSEQKAAQLAGYTVTPGDLVFSRVADVGRSVVIPDYADGWIISSNLMRMRLDSARFNPTYVMYQITNGPALGGQLTDSVNDAGRQIVNGKTMRRLRFPQPSLLEQTAIVDRAEALDAAIRSHRATMAGLRATKAGLLQDLLTGKVRVSV